MRADTTDREHDRALQHAAQCAYASVTFSIYEHPATIDRGRVVNERFLHKSGSLIFDLMG